MNIYNGIYVLNGWCIFKTVFIHKIVFVYKMLYYALIIIVLGGVQINLTVLCNRQFFSDFIISK